MDGELDGRVAVVTGTSRRRGIGRAIVLRLVDQGASVVVTSRRATAGSGSSAGDDWSGLSSLVAEVEARGGAAVAVEGDVTDPATATTVMATALDRFGQLDILVNCAGAARFGTLLVDLSDDEWEDVLRINLTGTFFMARAAARTMVEDGRGGVIVNVSSAAGRLGAPRMGAYSPAKFGVVGLTQVLALELAEHRIRVNCVAPASIETDMEDETDELVAGTLGVSSERARGARLRRITLGHMGDPSDVAAAVAFLVSDDATFITGQTVNVTGGLPFA